MSSLAVLQALALNREDSSSVLGALSAARENIRQARVVVPGELWSGLDSLYFGIKDASGQPVPRVLEALAKLVDGGHRLEGLIESGLTRDASHSFLRIGILLERADMSLRVLSELLPALAVSDFGRDFDDVRWSALLEALGIRSMYRRRHQHRIDLGSLLDFVLVDPSSSRSVSLGLRRLQIELDDLPRSEEVRAAIADAIDCATALSQSGPSEIPQGIQNVLVTLAAVHGALQSSYFPASSGEPSLPVPETDHVDPFEHLRREHAQVEAVLQVLEVLSAQAERFEAVEQAEIKVVMTFLTEFGELGHHEKEEMLTPKLVEHGFDWYEGPVALMRREHRHEHRFIRVLTELASQPLAWSADDRWRFVTDARELSRFLRAHMAHEQSEIFEPAAIALPVAVQARIGQAFANFDERQAASQQAVRERLTPLLVKYSIATG